MALGSRSQGTAQKRRNRLALCVEQNSACCRVFVLQPPSWCMGAFAGGRRKWILSEARPLSAHLRRLPSYLPWPPLKQRDRQHVLRDSQQHLQYRGVSPSTMCCRRNRGTRTLTTRRKCPVP